MNHEKLNAAMTAYAVSPTEANEAAIAAAIAPDLVAEIATLKACVKKLEASVCDARREPAPIQSAEVAELRRLAEEATPGPWERGSYGGVFRADGEGTYVVASGSLNGTWCRNHRPDEAWIAAANPAAILRLLDALAATPAQPIAPAADVSAPTDEREAFEAAMLSRHYEKSELQDFCSPESPRGGEYRNLNLQSDWQVWQAARAAASVSGPTDGMSPVYAWLEMAAQSDICDVSYSARTMMAYYQGAEFPAAPVSGQGASIVDEAEFLDLASKFHHESACEEFNETAYNSARQSLITYIDSRPRSEDSRAAQFKTESDLAEFLDSLHATKGDSVTNQKWEPAQRALSALVTSADAAAALAAHSSAPSDVQNPGFNGRRLRTVAAMAGRTYDMSDEQIDACRFSILGDVRRGLEALAAPSPTGESLSAAGWQAALDEVARATIKFPTWPTDPLHAVAVLGEEFGELTKAVLQTTYEPHKVKDGELRMEAIQTAAMSLRFLASLDRYEFAQCAQHEQAAPTGARNGE